MTTFPTPVERTADSDDFFDATAAGFLLLRRCSPCGAVRGPQDEVCLSCYATDHVGVPACGRATLVTWSTVHRSPYPGLVAPYVTAFVECEEGPWIPVRLLVDPGAALSSGDPVRIVFLPTGTQDVPGEWVPAARRAADPR